MKKIINKFQDSRSIAGIAAFAIHAGLAFAMLFSSAPAISQQAINISFVAPSQSKKSAHNNKETVVKTEDKHALKTAKNKQESKDTDTKSEKNRETSGREAPNATANNAAESEPIFNANYLNNPAPVYPSAARRNNIQGKVLLSVVVNSDGNAAEVKISRSSGFDMLDEAALDAVKQWRFIPAKKHGHSVTASVIVPIVFKII